MYKDWRAYAQCFLALGFFLIYFQINPLKIQKIWLFSQDQNPGINPPESAANSNPGSFHNLYGYIQISKKQAIPLWKSAYYHHNKYSVETIPIYEDSVVIGQLKTNHKNISIYKNPKSQLFELRLINPVPDETYSSFTLIGELNHYPFKFHSNVQAIGLKTLDFQ